MKAKIIAKDKKHLIELIDIELRPFGFSTNVYHKNADLNHIDVSNITDMSFLFHESKFNGNISKWDVSNVTDMTSMFSGSEFNKNISNWNTSKVQFMSSMFLFSKFNKNISNWNVSNVVNFDSMFFGSTFNQDISNWNVSNFAIINNMLPKTCIKPWWYITNIDLRKEVFAKRELYYELTDSNKSIHSHSKPLKI